MNKEQVYEMLFSSPMDSYYLKCISETAEQIKHTKQRLANMKLHQDTYENIPYIIYHRSLWDNYSLDLGTLAEMTQDFKEKYDELWSSGKYSDISFCKITNKSECTEPDIDQFSWDENSSGAFVYEWDSYEGFHHYGELWALVVTDQFTGNVEDTLTYKNLEKHLEQLERDLKINIESCKLFE